jgi:4-hydroxyacetophenone monooxygenase
MRSKHWVIYNPEIAHEVSEGMKFALAHIPHFKEWFRFRVYWFAADGLFSNVLKDPEWAGNDLAVSASNEGMRQWALSYLHHKFADRPDLIEKLTPDFPSASFSTMAGSTRCCATMSIWRISRSRASCRTASR